VKSNCVESEYLRIRFPQNFEDNDYYPSDVEVAMNSELPRLIFAPPEATRLNTRDTDILQPQISASS
jgi:hypothetical protein